MTCKHCLTKMYHKKQEIVVDGASLVDFNYGRRDTIDHIVEFEDQKIVVSIKPPVKDYQHYKALYGNELSAYLGK